MKLCIGLPSTLQCPSHSCRNLPESIGIHWNGTGIHRNGTKTELESSEMRLENQYNLCIYCPISFNSNRGVTCDHLFEILVSNTSQKEGDRVQPDTCPPPNWTLNRLIWHEHPPALSNKGHVMQDKFAMSSKSSKRVTCDV